MIRTVLMFTLIAGPFLFWTIAPQTVYRGHALVSGYTRCAMGMKECQYFQRLGESEADFMERLRQAP
jgi:hypothetical protein